MRKYIIILFIVLAPVVTFGQGIYSLSYNMSFGLGSTKDYISKPSFRGMTFIDARGFITDNITLGGVISWHVFYEDLEGTFAEDNKAISGKQLRYINSFPIMGTVHYYFGEPGITNLYVGTGIGAMSVEKRTDMGLWTQGTNKWHFGLAPEVGVLVPIGYNIDFLASVKYNQAFKSGDADAIQYLTISVGFAWW